MDRGEQNTNFCPPHKERFLVKFRKRSESFLDIIDVCTYHSTAYCTFAKGDVMRFNISQDFPSDRKNNHDGTPGMLSEGGKAWCLVY